MLNVNLPLFLQKKVNESTELQFKQDIVKKEQVITALFIVSLAGLLWSRAILSISMGLWLVFSIIHFRSWLFQWKSNPLLSWGLAPVILGLLGIWQSPFAGGGWDHILTLSTYLVVALSVISIRSINPGLFRTLGYCWVITAVAAVFYPLGWYLLYPDESLTRYSSGQSLPVFMDNDHVRFAIFLCAGALLAWFNRYSNKWLLPALVFLVLSTLFLATRTGWALIVLLGISFTLFNKKNTSYQKTYLLLGLLIVICITAWYLFPTIQHKIGYSLYDWQQYSAGKYDPTLSDNTRYAINKAAWHAISAGDDNVGWNNIPTVLHKHFQELYPGYSTSFGWPFNQWLFWGMGSGWMGMILFTLWLFYPAYYGFRKNKPIMVCWTFAIVASCLVEVNLGYQYGVWLHSWIIVWGFYAPEIKQMKTASVA